MPSAAPNSVIQVNRNLVNFFAGRFGDSPNSITAATNIPERYNLGAPQWGRFADILSQLEWMIALRVRLEQKDMARVPVLGQLATFIWEKRGTSNPMARLSLVSGVRPELASRPLAREGFGPIAIQQIPTARRGRAAK